MTLLRLIVPVAVLSCVLTGCETDEPKKPATLPAQAKAPELTSPVAQQIQQPPKIQEQPKPKPQADPADALIAQAEKLYTDGQANYQAGHLEAAKASFDQAFNILLSSKLDVRNDERLEREFDKIVEAVHELEMTALKQGDGFSEQRSEPAPIDEANEVTFPVDPNIKAKAEAEIKITKSDLPLVLNDQVASFINYFSNPRGTRHAGARLGAFGALSRHDCACPEGGRRSAGPHLPGAGRIGFPAAGAIAGGRSRHVAVHGGLGAGLWPASAAGGSMTVRTRRRPRGPPLAI